MGLRFRRSLKIAPGIRWNVGAKNTSFSFGPRGAKWTVGTRGSRTTVGIPGTGLSYTATQSSGRRRATTATTTTASRTATPRLDPARFGLSTFPLKLVVGLVSIVALLAGFGWVGIIGLVATIATPGRQAKSRRELAQRVTAFRDAMKSGGTGTSEVQRFMALRDELRLLPEDVPLESEMLEGLALVCAFEEAGSVLPIVDGHARVIGPETCHFSMADVLLDKRGPDERGQILITPNRIVFLGSTLTEIPLRKVALFEVEHQARALRVQRSDRQTPLRFCFATMGDAMMADAVLKVVSGPTAAT